MTFAEKIQIKPLILNNPSFIEEISQQKIRVVSNAAIIAFTSSAAAVLPVLPLHQPGATGISGGVQAIRFRSYSAFVICLMFAFSCAFTSMVLLPKRPKASRLLHISAVFWLSSAFTLLFLFSQLSVLNGTTQAWPFSVNRPYVQIQRALFNPICELYLAFPSL